MQKRYEDFQLPDSNIYRRTNLPTFPEDRCRSESLPETTAKFEKHPNRQALAKMGPNTKKAGRNEQTETTLYLFVPTGFQKVDQRVDL